jgi:hypothetical protein
VSTLVDSPVWLVVITWPIALITLVALSLLLTPPDQRATVLRALAEVIQAARGGRRR